MMTDNWPLPAPDWAQDIDVEGTRNRDGHPMAFYYGSDDDDNPAYLMRIDVLTEFGVMLGPLQIRMWSDGNTHDWEPKSSDDVRAMATALLELAEHFDPVTPIQRKSCVTPATRSRRAREEEELRAQEEEELPSPYPGAIARRVNPDLEATAPENLWHEIDLDIAAGGALTLTKYPGGRWTLDVDRLSAEVDVDGGRQLCDQLRAAVDLAARLDAEDESHGR